MPTCRIVVDDDTDNPIVVTRLADFPDVLGRYRESIWAQMTGKDYYSSQLVLRSGEDLITYDFYSEQAWFDAKVETEVEVRMAPIKRAEAEAEAHRAEAEREAEIEHRVQERMAEIEAARRARGLELASIYQITDMVINAPVYIGQTKKPVAARIQDHVRQALSPAGIPRVHALLRQRIEEQRFPTVQVLRQVYAQDARREEAKEIRRLIAEKAPLLNRENTHVTTWARLRMGDIELLGTRPDGAGYIAGTIHIDQQ